MKKAGHVRRRGGGLWKIFIPSSQFCCEPKNALKHKVLQLKKNYAVDL